MAGPKIPDPKSPQAQVNVQQLGGRVGATAPLPRQAFGAPQPASLGSAMIGGASAQPGRYDPRMAMELLKRGQ